VPPLETIPFIAELTATMVSVSMPSGADESLARTFSIVIESSSTVNVSFPSVGGSLSGVTVIEMVSSSPRGPPLPEFPLSLLVTRRLAVPLKSESGR
jgi:hypothetical protein